MKKYIENLLLTGFTEFTSTGAGSDTPDPKILVIYYSLTGVTEYMAQTIQQKTAADLFRLETLNPYSTDSSTLTEIAKKELETGNLPDLKKMPDLLSSYDLILVGGPVWWYTVSTPVMRFLKEANFNGIKVAAFNTHEGGVGRYFEDFKKQAKNAIVLVGLDVYQPKRSGNKTVEQSLNPWVSKLLKQ